MNKGLDQLSEEGAVQVFRPVGSNSQFLGVVGVLQFEIVQYRIQAEYGVNVQMESLPYSAARWFDSDNKAELEKFKREQSNSICLDQHENETILLDHDWRIKFLQERYPGIEFISTSENVARV